MPIAGREGGGAEGGGRVGGGGEAGSTAWQKEVHTSAFKAGEVLFLALDQSRRHLHDLPIGQLYSTGSTGHQLNTSAGSN